MTPTVGRDGLRFIITPHCGQQVRLAASYDSPPQGATGDDPLDYFTVRERRDRLASTAERNMLGQLKGTAGSWQQLVSAYEKGGEWDDPTLRHRHQHRSTAVLL